MKRIVLTTAALLLFAMQAMPADATDIDAMAKFKEYVNQTVTEVKQAEDPAEKRSILSSSLERMKKAADVVAKMPGLDADDKAAVAAFDANISDKLDQLNGTNGYERVGDTDLDEYADYVQQDLEQAQRIVISISLVALLLIILILLLI